MIVKVYLRARAVIVWVVVSVDWHIELMILIVDSRLEVRGACCRYHISLALLMIVVVGLVLRSGIRISMIAVFCGGCSLHYNPLIVVVEFH